MGIFSSFTKKNAAESVLVIDVGSSSVTAAYVHFGTGAPFISATVSTDIAILSDLSLSRFENEMLTALHQSLTALRVGQKSSPARIQVYLASPWYASQVRLAKLSRPTQFMVSKTILNDMVAKELKAFEDEEIAGKLNTGEAVRMIESNTLEVKLNGYTHDNPVNVPAKELELSLFFSVAPEHLLKKIEEMLAQDFGHRTIKFSSFVSASFIVSRDFFPHEGTYLLVDIGGEVTDVSFIKNGTLIQSVSFPEGRNFMLRRLGAELKRSIAESITLCMLYLEDKVESSIKETCTKILTQAKMDWLGAFQKALFSISNELSVPDTVLLTVDGDIGPWFVEAIRREEFRQYSLTEKEFKIVALDATFFHQALSFGEDIPRNPFIMIEVLASVRKQK